MNLMRSFFGGMLCCEPLLRRWTDGSLVCICQCGGTYEPAPENRVLAFRSADDGETWACCGSVWPEDGRAVYATALRLQGHRLLAYISCHSGHFLDWTCHTAESRDGGRTWEPADEPPFFPENTLLRSGAVLEDGTELMTYQHYPMTREENERVKAELGADGSCWHTHTPWVENGVLRTRDGGLSWERCPACRMEQDEGWIWSEPTVARLPGNRVVMLLRKDRSGWLWRCDSPDGGRTWGDVRRTEIPNPTNKPRLLNLPGDGILLLHTPNNTAGGRGQSGWWDRYPYEAWYSGDGLRSWSQETVITHEPGSYSYSDAICEPDAVRLVVERNRNEILYFRLELNGLTP